MKHDLIILGQGPSMTDCPFDTEVWASLTVLGYEGFEDKEYSKLFLFDDPNQKPDEMKGLKIAQARGLPIVSSRAYDCATEFYPLFRIRDRFSTIYFRNDTSYMIAYALYLGYKSLLLCGVDQGPHPMYQMGRPFVTYWLGVASSMGVQWEVGPNSLLWEEDQLAALKSRGLTGGKIAVDKEFLEKCGLPFEDGEVEVNKSPVSIRDF